MHRLFDRIASSWRELGPLAGGSWWRVGALAAASALTGVAEAALLGLVVQIGITLSEGARAVRVALGPLDLRAGTTALLALAAALAVGRLALQLVVSWLPARIAADVQAGLARSLFEAYARAEWPAQAAEREGELQELTTTYPWRAAAAALTLGFGLAALVTFAALLASAFVISARTAAVLLGMAAALFVAFRPLARLQRRLSDRLSRLGLEVASAVAEAARVAEEHHVFGTAEAQVRAVTVRIEAYRGPFFRSQLVSRMSSSAHQSSAILLLVAGLAIVAALAAPQLTALGTVVLILVRSFSYGQQVQGNYTTLQEFLPFVARVRDRIAHFERHAPPAGSRRIDRIESLALEDVSYAYARGRPVLEHLSLRLPAGSVVGIVGPSGAGKSTLVQLLLRLRRPTAGRLLINGIPAEDVDWQDWQARVAYVPQDPKLIRGTIADNIRFYRPLPMEDVERAARTAHIHDEIVSELGGYDAVIDQRGDAVSGGQRQRLCLARALAARPELLVLDEPTSALDPRSEALILETLAALRGKVTTVVVAHRAAVLQICDGVWELRRGRLAIRAADRITRSLPS